MYVYMYLNLYVCVCVYKDLGPRKYPTEYRDTLYTHRLHWRLWINQSKTQWVPFFERYSTKHTDEIWKKSFDVDVQNF